MNQRVDLKPIKAFLLRHGHTQEKLENLSKEEIIKLYETDVRTATLNYLNYTSDETYTVVNTLDEADIGELKAKVRENIENTIMLIDIIKDGFNDFDYNDISDILTLSIKSISAHKMKKILRIAYREFQETLLDKIAKQLKELPIEERKTIMNHYENIRSDTQRLKDTILELSDENRRQQILDMAHLKLLIVRDFMPKKVFNETYREYLNNMPEKLKMVDDILSMSGIHSKNYLKNLPIEELEALQEEILEAKRQDERDEKIVGHYTQMLDESMYGSDEEEFSNVCTRILANLSQKQILMITEYLSTKNPVFFSRFNTLMRDAKKSMEAKG